MTKNRHLIDHPPDDKVELSVLYGLKLTKEENESKYSLSKCIVPLTRIAGNDTIDCDSSEGLKDFGTFLHVDVTQQSRMTYDSMESLSPVMYVEKKVNALTPLSALLYGLATGTSEIDKDTIRKPYLDETAGQTSSEKTIGLRTQSQFFAIAAAADMLLRSTSNHPYEFQMMLGRMLDMEGIKRETRDLLSRSRVIPSRNCSQRTLCRSVVENMRRQIDIDPTCNLHFLIGDNFGFKAIANHDASKIGTVQYTQLIDTVLSKEQLVSAGILDDDGNLLLSTEASTTWEQLHNDEGAAARLTATTSKDHEALTECVAESMLTAIEDALAGNFAPGRRRVRSARVSSRSTKVKALRNTPLEDLNHGDLEAVLGTLENEERNNREHHPHHLKSNQTASIIKKDLARTSTVKAIVDYVLAVQDKALERIGPQTDAEKPLMLQIGSMIIFDGQPSAQAQSLIAQMHKKYRGRIHVFFGGFHTLMKLHNSMGKMFDYIFKVIYSSYRRTFNRILWIQFPGDPRQLEQEFPELLQAVYGSAAQYFYDKHKRVPSVSELNEYMLERGKKYPVVGLIILYCRFAEIAKMMKMSERKEPHGDTELFFTTLRFALTIFTMTHKTDYVNLISNFFVEWEMASPALRAIYKTYIFTQTGPTGAPMFSDLFLEQHNRYTRGDVGKVWSKGLDAKLEQSLKKNMIDRQEDGHTVEQLRVGKQTTKASRSKTHIVTTESSPILKMYPFIHESKFFCADEPPIIGKNKDNRSPIYAEEGSYNQGKTGSTNPELLYFHLEGAKRAEEYMQVNLLDEENKVGRTEADVSLKSIPLTAADLNTLRQERIDKDVSVSVTRLEAIMSIDEMKDKIASTHFTLTFELGQEGIEEPRVSGKRKNELAKLLVKLRKQHFKVDSETKTYLEEQAKKAFDDESQPEISLDDVFALDLYKLSADVLARDEYTKPLPDSIVK